LPGIQHVAHGDIGSAADAVISLITRKPDMQTAAREVTRRFGLTRMVEAYVAAITGPLSQAPVGAQQAAPGGPHYAARDSGSARNKPTHWRLAPWCYAEGDRIYHDYLYRFATFPRLTAALAAGKGVVSMRGRGELEREFGEATSDGFLIPA
jgi:hypothetical protein